VIVAARPVTDLRSPFTRRADTFERVGPLGPAMRDDRA
jgi:hypothetical protein